MSESKNHEPYIIPVRNPNNTTDSGIISNDIVSNQKKLNTVSFDSQLFAEIEIDNDIDTSLKPTPIPHPTTQPIMDDKRRIFNSMRELSWGNHSFYQNSKFYNKQTQYENSRIFYKQAVFMKDFEDDFTESFPFSAYFPYYQLMNYEQFRTYFTWRTRVRKGYIGNTSLSYVFVYIYELLNNIGIKDPAEGLKELMSFWNVYKFYDTTFEKYLVKWIKDYHIYYQLPITFQDFLYENKLQHYYPDIAQYEPSSNFDFEYLSGISIYKIKQSSFYNDETNQLISDCFNFVVNKLTSLLKDAELEFKDLIMQSSAAKNVWTPFRGALFYPTLKQPDRQIVLSETEVYVCKQNTWFLSTISVSSCGKHLIGYVMKQMEAVLRKVTNYKHKLSANLNSVDDEIQQKFRAAGISLEKMITDSVLEFYRERNKIIISVNDTSLDKIRLEALDTQEKLIIPENDLLIIASVPYTKEPVLVSEEKEIIESPVSSSNISALSDGWTSLKNSLNETELNALSVLLQDTKDIKQYADNKGIMLEVLADSINEKAFDHIGDNILELDDSMMLYDEYKEKIMIMVG